VTAIEKANKAKQALRIISRFFSPQEMLSCQLHCFTTDFIMEQRFGFLLPCLQLLRKTQANIIKDGKNLSKRLQRTVFF
jgi:hypothetical protein